MSILRIAAVSTLSLCLYVSPMTARADEAQQELTPRQVAEKFDYVLRLAHQSLISKFKMSTCKYKFKNKQMRCVEKPRVRTVENVLKNFGDDVRALSVLVAPARDKGIGMLAYEYYDTQKDNDAWMYLPALNKIKRIVASRESADGGAYFGTEYFIEDLQSRKLDNYTYKILSKENLRVVELNKGYVERPTYVLEWTPTAHHLKTTNYGKLVTWIDAERFIHLKSDMYDHNHVIYKKHTVKDVQYFKQKWMPRQITMNNVMADRVTVMVRSDIVFDLPVDDEYFTQRTLTDFAFRERHLNKYRAHFKK